ncbi:MAG: serine/threonine protein kinase, partial [Pseudomonadales bacterium]|nr:serine/threonine protein kinase [Pseudomonadales bacterium]
MKTDVHPFTNLSPDLVMDAVESVGYRCDFRNLELNSYENRVYQIGIEDGEPVIGKFYRPDRWTDEQIIEEHEFTRELADQEISVIAPLALDGDRTLMYHEGFRFALYPRRGGRAPNVDDLSCLEVLGRHIGLIHAVGGRQSFRYRPEVCIEDYCDWAREFLLDNGFIPETLIPAYESVSEGLIADLRRVFTEVNFSRGIRLHGDCHMGNVLWRYDLPHFVDFDDARTGPPVQDLWMMLSGDREAQQQQLSKILGGYREFCDFDYSQLRLIEPLRTLRMMHHSAWIAR